MIGRIDVVSGNPTILLVCVLITNPFHEMPEWCPEPAIDLGVDDLFDFEVFFAVNEFDRSRRRLFSTGERIRKVRLELRDMENRMNTGERLR